MAQTNQFDFMAEYVLAVLKENGLGDLTGEQKQAYVPQLLSQVEMRLGLELLPRLSPEQKEKMVALANNPAAPAADWRAFWQAAIPDFDEVVKKILLEFAERVRQILNK